MATGEEEPSGLATRTLRQIVAARSTHTMNSPALSPREVTMMDWLAEELGTFLEQHPAARAPDIAEWLIRNGWT